MTALCQQSLGIFCWKIFGVVTNKLKVISVQLAAGITLNIKNPCLLVTTP